MSEQADASNGPVESSELTEEPLSLSFSGQAGAGVRGVRLAVRRSAERSRAELGWLRVRASHGASPDRAASSASSDHYLRIERARERVCVRTHSGMLEPRDPLAFSVVHAPFDVRSELE